MCHLDIRQIRRTEEKTVDLQQLVQSTRPDEGWIHRRDLSGYRIIVSTPENRILLPSQYCFSILSWSIGKKKIDSEADSTDFAILF